MDRRRFVKGCVLAASAGALAAGGFGIVRATLEPRAARPAVTRYFGALRVAGPAPRGVPYVPIALDEGGAFVAKRALTLFGRRIDVLDWHRYCGRGEAPGLLADYVGDDVLRYATRPEYEDLLTPWWKDRVGEPVRPEHFPDVGFGADFVWRSEGARESQTLHGVILKADVRAIRHVGEPQPPATGLTWREMEFVEREVFHEGFIAVSSHCTHFCAIAGYKQAEPLARPRDAWENVYCTSHGANFDPRAPVAYAHEAGAP